MMSNNYRLPKRFESLDKSIDERNLRIKALKKAGDKNCLALVCKLENCAQGDTCNSPACPVCFRDTRIKLYQELMTAARRPRDWRVITLVFYKDAMTSDELSKWDNKRLLNKLRSRLRAANIKGPVLGGFEMDYHVQSGLWMPHLHLLVPAQSDALTALRRSMNRLEKTEINGKVKRPMMLQQLSCRPRQLSYLLKSYWSRIEAYEDINNKGRTKKYRLRDQELCGSLLKLDQLGFSQLIFRYGTRSSGKLAS